LPKPYHILGFEIRAYSHPLAQACLLGCVLFPTVGTYNVITFLGGAGQQTAYLSDGEPIFNLLLFHTLWMKILWYELLSGLGAPVSSKSGSTTAGLLIEIRRN